MSIDETASSSQKPGDASGGLASMLKLAGPAVVASIAYMDPGNFATNIEAGSSYGYSLLWVALTANIGAMLFQSLSAKLGIVTGRNLAEVCRDRIPLPLRIVMWIVSEIASMATDLAEFVGGAIGLSLLFHISLLVGMLITAVVTYGILMVQGRGFRTIEIVIGALISVIGLCYVAELCLAPVNWRQAAAGLVVPSIPDGKALAISVAMIGATIMPHALYLHSGLMSERGAARDDIERQHRLRFSNWECVVALAVAGAVNIAMVIMAASAFHAGHSDVADIQTAYHTLTPLLGAAAAVLFLTSLIASGISSSVVGTMAGQMIMQGFIGYQIPLWVRRLLTMLPAFAVVLWGVDTTKALVYSQVVLSFALPIPMIALVMSTRNREIMGDFANNTLVGGLAIVASVIVLCLNVVLLAGAVGLHIPGMSAG